MHFLLLLLLLTLLLLSLLSLLLLLLQNERSVGALESALGCVGFAGVI